MCKTRHRSWTDNSGLGSLDYQKTIFPGLGSLDISMKKFHRSWIARSGLWSLTEKNLQRRLYEHHLIFPESVWFWKQLEFIIETTMLRILPATFFWTNLMQICLEFVRVCLWLFRNQSLHSFSWLWNRFVCLKLQMDFIVSPLTFLSDYFFECHFQNLIMKQILLIFPRLLKTRYYIFRQKNYYLLYFFKTNNFASLPRFSGINWE